MNKEHTFNEKIAKIQTELKAKKTKFNKFGKYLTCTNLNIM